MTTALEARVKAINTANDFANKLYQVLTTLFKGLVGQNVFKQDGKLLAKYEKLLPQFPSTVRLSVYFHYSAYSLAWTVKTCESVPPTGCVYHEVTVYVGSVQNGVLTGLTQSDQRRNDYTVNEVLEKRRLYNIAREAYEEARSNLHPFGEYDR